MRNVNDYAYLHTSIYFHNTNTLLRYTRLGHRGSGVFFTGEITRNKTFMSILR